MNDIYWDSFYRSGKIENYLKYRGNKYPDAKGSGYELKKPEGAEGKSDCN